MKQKYENYLSSSLRWLVFALSVALIVFISVDTFLQKPFLTNSAYMHFQFWVCIIFILVFFTEVYLAPRHWHYFWHNIFFLLVSIPYLSIISRYRLDLSEQELYFIRFIPLIRAAYAMVLVVGYVSTNRIVGLFWAYLSIVILGVYFASLIFYEQESPVNPDITNYWSSLWWCSLEATTIGSSVNPVTIVGKILAAVLAIMGILIFPMFTVYLGNMMSRYISFSKKIRSDSKSPASSTTH